MLPLARIYHFNLKKAWVYLTKSVFHVFYLRFQVGPVAEQANFLSPYPLSLLLPLHNSTPIVPEGVYFVWSRGPTLPYECAFHHLFSPCLDKDVISGSKVLLQIRRIMPQEKKIQDLVKFYQFISLSLIDYHRVNNPKYTFHPSREVLHLSTF